jgi:hypothetical protein
LIFKVFIDPSTEFESDGWLHCTLE